jgi:hypothetical protein
VWAGNFQVQRLGGHMVAQKKGKRPVTGRLLVASNEYIFHTCNGIEYSWLSMTDPSRFLVKEDHLKKKYANESQVNFLLQALKAPFPEYVLDILVNKEGDIIFTQGISVLWIPEGSYWNTAKIVRCIPWREIVKKENEKYLWRKWSTPWFLSML